MEAIVELRAGRCTAGKPSPNARMMQDERQSRSGRFWRISQDPAGVRTPGRSGSSLVSLLITL